MIEPRPSDVFPSRTLPLRRERMGILVIDIQNWMTNEKNRYR